VPALACTLGKEKQKPEKKVAVLKDENPTVIQNASRY